MKYSNLITILFFSSAIFNSKPILVEKIYVNENNVSDLLGETLTNSDNDLIEKYKRNRYELLSEIIRYYKNNKIDINQPKRIMLSGRYRYADILGIFIENGNLKLVELLLNNGAKVKNKYVFGHRTIKPLILNKSMAEILIPRGASVPTIDAVIEEWIQNPQAIDTFNKTSNEIGVEYIKYLFEHGAAIGPNTLNVLKTNLINMEKDLLSFKPKHYKFFKDMKNYVEEKLNQTQKK